MKVAKTNEQRGADQPIILIGFMGVGKTTVGRLVAQKLNCPFVDLDHEIERESGLKISQIFEQFGEPYFRQLERDTLRRQIINAKRKVIALGGGAFMQEEIRTLCLEHGLVIFLNLSWDEWLKRLKDLRADRPLLQQNNIPLIKQLYQERLPVYAMSHWQITTDGLCPVDIVQIIVSKLNQ
jgi:shikimate kinase